MTRYTYIMASLGSASLKLGVKLLCILIGIPASGKSTFIHSFKSYLESTESNLNLICVEFDAFLPRDTRCQAGGSPDETFIWKKHRDFLREQIDSFLGYPFGECPDKQFSDLLISQLHTDFNNKAIILVLDDTFHYRSMRYEYYRLARKHRTGFLQLCFETSLEECIVRNKAREHSVPEQAILNIHGQLSNPAGSVFKWEQETIKIDTAKEFEFDAIVIKMQESSLKLPPPLADSEQILSHKEAARNETNTSITHQCDIGGK